MTRRDPLRTSATDLPVLLNIKPVTAVEIDLLRVGTALCSSAFLLTLIATIFAGSVLIAEAATASNEQPSVFAALVTWMPLVFKGFLFNLLVSVFSMALGTIAGVMLGLAQVSLTAKVRRSANGLTQFFRNAPWLVLLFYAMFLIPFEIQLLGRSIPFPAWIKAVIGLSLPVAANVSEIVRGGVQSIPLGQWESAESLAFTRRQTLWQIILPQAVKRMIPPWMNLYAVLTMATSLISIVGVDEALTYARAALSAERRPELLVPMYTMLLLFFFLYCYPIARYTQVLERRFAVKI